MRVADLTFKQRFFAIGALGLLGFAAVIWIGSSTLADVRIGGPRYEAIGQDKELLNEITPPTLFLGPAFFYVLEAAVTTSAETRGIALARADEGIAAYRKGMTYWEANTIERGLGLREKLYTDARSAGDACIDGFTKDVLPLLKSTPVDQAKAMAAIEALIPTFRKHRTAIEEGQAILLRRVGVQKTAAFDAAESGQRTVLWVAIGSALLALLVGTLLLRSVLRSVVAGARPHARHGRAGRRPRRAPRRHLEGRGRRAVPLGQPVPREDRGPRAHGEEVDDPAPLHRHRDGRHEPRAGGDRQRVRRQHDGDRRRDEGDLRDRRRAHRRRWASSTRWRRTPRAWPRAAATR